MAEERKAILTICVSIDEQGKPKGIDAVQTMRNLGEWQFWLGIVQSLLVEEAKAEAVKAVTVNSADD